MYQISLVIFAIIIFIISCFSVKKDESSQVDYFYKSLLAQEIPININSSNDKQTQKQTINLIYFQDKSKYGNFGDELSKFITKSLINKNKYNLVFDDFSSKNHENFINLVVIGSYIHKAPNNSYIYGSGVRTDPPIEGKKAHNYEFLNVCAVRGPKTLKFLEERKGIKVSSPAIFGDPGLLVREFFQAERQNMPELHDKTCLVPHKSNLEIYLDRAKAENGSGLPNIHHIINPLHPWQKVISQISNCKYIISSSLHGLIIADSYNIPNLWLEEFVLSEGDFKFLDYFESQGREVLKISNLSEFSEDLLYFGGNKIDLGVLRGAFPFS